MSLICPACQATYNVNTAVLGPNGRKVRCATCGHTWLALPPLPFPPAASENQFDKSPAPETIPVTPQPAQWDDGPQIKIIPPPDDVFAKYVAQSTTRQGAQETSGDNHQPFRPVETKKPAKPDSAIVVLFKQFFIPASLAMLAIVLATLIMARETIVKKAPDAMVFYNLLGINPLPPGGGLAILNAHDESRFSPVDNALVIHGDLANRTSADLKVPLFKMDITSPTGQTKTFMARGPIDKIAAGAVVPFTLERAGFAAEGWDVKLSFGDGTEHDGGKAMQVVDTPKPAANKEQK